MPDLVTDHVRTVAVTGATGFIGARIVDHLTRDCGLAVRALTRKPQPDRQGITWIAGALEDERSLDDLATGADALVHVAGLIKARNKRAFIEVNTEGSRRVASAAAKAGARLILMSSLAAREPQLSAYAASKKGGEDATIEASSGNSWTILRPAAVYGPGDREILKLLKAMKRGIAPAPGAWSAAGRNRFSLIHVDDLARAVSAVLWRSESFGQLYEIGDTTPGGYEMADIAAIAANIFGRKVKVISLPYPLLAGAGGINELIAMISRRAPMLSRGKARELAHPDWTVHGPGLPASGLWEAKIGAENGLADSVDWYRNAGLL